MNSVPVVVVIGGGASGMLVCANLIRYSTAPLKIVVINSGANFGTGVAYQSSSDKHLLNVMAAKMSAFPEDPDHFVRWLIEDYSLVEIESLRNAYLPRKIYGEYLKSVWQKVLHQKPDSIQVKMIGNRAIKIDHVADSKFSVHLRDSEIIEASYVVLATGNASPRNPSIANMDFYKSKKYFNNPWLSSSVENLDLNKDVFIIGNGLTMADTVQSLVEHKFKGTIHSLSPHGFGILQHQHTGEEYHGLISELEEVHSLYELVCLFRKHIKKVRGLGLSVEPVVDSLRSKTQSLWISFSLDEKRKFVSRLRHLWGVARHRLPIQTFDLIQQLKFEGQLKVWAGQIINITEVKNEVQVDFFDKKSKEKKSLIVGRVINCTGPELDLQKMDNPLFESSISSGLIVPDALNMGLVAAPKTLEVINQNNKKVESFFVLGDLLRGLLWETTAIGEIRSQAKHIAYQIIAKEQSRV